MLSLGILLSIRDDGTIVQTAPLRRIRSKLNAQVINHIKFKKKGKLPLEGDGSVFQLLLPRIQSYLSQYSGCVNQKDLVDFFKGYLFQILKGDKRGKRQRSDPQLNQLTALLSKYREKALERKRRFLDGEDGERERPNEK